jgi:long-chain acyl-CoA synthetase
MPFANFWERAAAEPAHTAVVEADGREVAAGEVLASANRLVHGLRAVGLRPGDAIAAVLPSSLEAYEIFLAMQQAGWYLTPINYHLVAPEIAYILRDCEARAFFAHAQFAEACSTAADEAGIPADARFAVGSVPGFHAFDELKAGQPDSAPARRTLGSLMNYTAGTTGRPKGVRRALAGTSPEESDLGAPLKSYGVTEDERDNVHLLVCPWYHTAPLVMSMPSLHLGHTLAIVPHFDARLALELIERDRVTITHMVPTQLVRLLALPEDVRRQYDVSSLRHVIHGAAPCAPEVKRRMIDWWGPVLDEYYNSTERVGGTIISSREWLERPGSVGKARDDNEIVILDEQGVRLPPGEVGIVYSLAHGDFEYFNDSDKTAHAKRGRFATVGDVGYLDADGYLYLCDRGVDTIISGGVNIYPAEVEQALICHSAVADVAVFGVPNDEWGEEVKAVVEAAPGQRPGAELAAELLAFLDGRIARYKLPRTIDFVAALPRDPSGKLYKRKLRDPYWVGRGRAI